MSTEADKARSQARRAWLRSNELCINGENHGKATHGILCGPCRAKHRERNPLKAAALAMSQGKRRVRLLRTKIVTLVPVRSSWELL